MEDTKQYLTYTEYQSMEGNLAEIPFKLQELKARKIIDNYTFGRLKNFTNQIEEVKSCMFELIENNNKISNLGTIRSESVGKVSTTYSTSQELSSNTRSIVRQWLSDCKLEDGTPYLYRG